MHNREKGKGELNGHFAQSPSPAANKCMKDIQCPWLQPGVNENYVHFDHILECLKLTSENFRIRWCEERANSEAAVNVDVDGRMLESHRQMRLKSIRC